MHFIGVLLSRSWVTEEHNWNGHLILLSANNATSVWGGVRSVGKFLLENLKIRQRSLRFISYPEVIDVGYN